MTVPTGGVGPGVLLATTGIHHVSSAVYHQEPCGGEHIERWAVDDEVRLAIGRSLTDRRR